MKLNKLAAIPAIAIAAGIGLAACGSVKAPVAKPAVTVMHTVAGARRFLRATRRSRGGWLPSVQ